MAPETDVAQQLRRTIARSRRAERASGREWVVSLLTLVALGIAVSGLRGVLTGGQWWAVAMTVPVAVLGTSAVVRALARNRLIALLAGAVAGVAVFTALFAADVAWFAIIPNAEVLQRFGQLQAAGSASIAGQGVPAVADQGITFLICLGVAALAFAMDLFSTGARMPVLSGLALVVVLLVPTVIDADASDPFTFVLTAGAYLGMLLAAGRGIRLKPAVALGAAALAAALIVPLALPESRPAALNGAGGGTSALNPIVDLGADLRRGDPSIAYTYTTTGGGDYFRLSVLDDFSGATWAPTNRPEQGEDLDTLGGIPGLVEGVPTAAATTDVVAGDVTTPWLPVPYAAQSITGLEGTWRTDAERLTVGTGDSDVRGQRYTVESSVAQPSIDQLRAAGTTVPAGFDGYLDLPNSMPDSVRETAEQVAGEAPTHYDAAQALQDFFHSGEFTYSEDAPVTGGYDGSGARVLDEFLAVRAGYCVHFSSAMAAMARSLGIPARVVVGFTAGSAITQDGGQAFRVTTDDYHAWPELYFEGVGWVRFEPTPGRGDTPQFPQAVQDDPETPDVDESVPVPPPSAATPTTAPTTTASATPDGLDPDAAGGPAASSSPPPTGWLVLAGVVGLLVAPAVVRLVRRARRVSRVRSGSARAAWDELLDTLHDLGIEVDAGRTPRRVADDLLDAGAPQPAVDRLLAAVEHEAYAPQPRPPAAADLRAVRWALMRTAGAGSVVLALAWPRSLFAGWMPHPRAAAAVE